MAETRNGTAQETALEMLAAGAVAGFAATAPMTLAMTALHAALPAAEQAPLPPRPLTRQVLRRSGLPWPEDGMVKRSLTLGAHFGYGAATGAAYPLWRRAVGPGPGSGAAFGLAVWAGSYLGWIPALGLLPPATRHSGRRVALMLAAHVVWGAATALVADRPAPRPRRRAVSSGTGTPQREAAWSS
ncbi:hypothetical protein [Rhodospirillum centenum]|uniref:DUF1440 domain-containing protein n=1 Tax=Rhodospirillum centenum (strain ATCC 51521 / SW) TaxID=414684 RepID=B6IU58_RHOCS|nr:hypothetical protein [Rhodospirillum centenum]ACI99935.1 conserved hypothetical protein [Rhodospirillum centenum SW]